MWTYSISKPEDFPVMRQRIIDDLLSTTPENYGHWQQLNISQSPEHATYELMNVHLEMPMPEKLYDSDPGEGRGAINTIWPDLPWAEGHFLERVGGKPVNPGDWHDRWPFHKNGEELHLKGKIYDHNYMERIWPKTLLKGYRFPVGDLMDVVNHLTRKKGTRQAFLPLWFPEDTGAIEDQRVPCTLGYQFIIREDKLSIVYLMRSCDIYRHFTNDVYMAVRLAQWVLSHLPRTVTLGNLNMSITSLHGFYGDTEEIRRINEDRERVEAVLGK